MNPKSSTLFHFTDNIEILKAILKNGFWPRFCLEDVNWLGAEKFDFISYPMVCFCDIPLSRIEDHVDFYGRFGIGMTRKWAEQSGLNPVLYISPNNTLAAEMRNMNMHANKLAEPDREESKITMRYVFAYSKPTTGTMVIKGQPVRKEFYQESEWRFVPKKKGVTDYLTKDKYSIAETLAEANDATQKHCLLKFDPADVKYIFVERDADIPSIMNYIQAELDGHPAAALKILSSRVLSLESFHADL